VRPAHASSLTQDADGWDAADEKGREGRWGRREGSIEQPPPQAKRNADIGKITKCAGERNKARKERKKQNKKSKKKGSGRNVNKENTKRTQFPIIVAIVAVCALKPLVFCM
jgi:hypothetical protein